jgi:hypothetical protein
MNQIAAEYQKNFNADIRTVGFCLSVDPFSHTLDSSFAKAPLVNSRKRWCPISSPAPPQWMTPKRSSRFALLRDHLLTHSPSSRQTYLLTLDVFMLTHCPLDSAVMLEAVCNRSKAHLAKSNAIYRCAANGSAASLCSHSPLLFSPLSCCYLVERNTTDRQSPENISLR